ncbi:unnamed protein product [Caenorhabditis angaria]|uniref:phosphatidylinositol 3-kinase n=1 Tax=Caenorhabditis angaria TaxID=860376 RepID=A0A9P1J109_9PELO|nr:unnamed protein product [Caenorhabditis angaria]
MSDEKSKIYGLDKKQTMSDDEELQFAIELSKQTFKDEENKRLSGVNDLIRFESPEEPKRREQIDHIKSLYNVAPPTAAPAPFYGFRQSFDDSSPVVTSPVFASSSLPYQNAFNFIEPPPRPPKPLSLRGHFPPSPSISYLRESPAPPLPPRLNRQTSQPTSSTPLRFSQPNFTLQRNELSPIKPFDISSSTSITDTSSSFREDTSMLLEQSSSSVSPYQPSTHLYVPYRMMNMNQSYGALLNGDLIDLSTMHSEDNSNVSLDEIWREFDPLYIKPIFANENNSNMPPIQYSYNKTPLNNVPGSTIKVEVEKQELTVASIKLIDSPDPIEVQMKKIRNRGLIRIEKNPDFFIAPTVDYMTTCADSLKVEVYRDHRWRGDTNSRATTCDINETIGFITKHALAWYEPNIEEGKKYGLKIYGLNQFLANDSLLGSNLYTGHCLLHGDDVKLELSLFEKDRRFSEVDFYEPWSSMKSQLRYATFVDKEDVEHTLEHLEQEMTSYESAFDEGSTLLISQASQKVKQVVKLLCKILHEIVPEKMYIEMQKYLAATTDEQLNQRRSDFVRELRNFLEIYCRCTVSRYMLPPLVQPEKAKEELLLHNDNIQIILNSVQSIPEEWIRNYSEFYLSLDVYYGTQALDGHSNRSPKKVQIDSFFPKIPLDLYAKLKRLKLCMYPRETRIIVSISGTSKVDNVETTQILAYCSVPLFDENSALRQGPYFLPLTILKKNLLKPFGPYPYIKDARDPILTMSLKVWDTDIYFPKVSVDMQCIPQDFSMLDLETQEYLLELIERQDPSNLEYDDQELIWQKRLYMTNQPEALPLVLSSLTDWSFVFLAQVYQILEVWAPLRPEIAMQLLLPQYPDERIRSYAVRWLSTGSTDFLYNTIAQFIEALRFELYEQSSLADFILELSTVGLDFTYELYWQFQQRVDHCSIDDFPYAFRCQNLQQKIIDEHNNSELRRDVKLQHELLSELDSIQDDLRSRPNDSDQEKLFRLRTRLGILDSKLLQNKVRLPICPSFDCVGIRVDECNIFNSNAKPLKIVFRGMTSDYAIIHKRDDDMRQDAFVMKMVNEMDRIWKSNNLDLRIITFRVMPVGFKRGMGELVSNCATLLEIQKEDGLTGVLNHEVLRKWLMKHNSSEFTYKQALDNFIRSCAGWCIVTYVLGIGDRHNDNILFTKKGHVFHIDFGKYMGDWQMAGGFRRDRVPFVFTSEMFYVINGGKTQTINYQKFIDYCCKAFNYLRRNKNILTNLLRIMVCSDIPGINADSIAFVEKNLMLNLSETAATIQFTEMIQNSLNSTSTRLNFVAHTFAQFMSSSSSFTNRDDNKLSFVPELYTMKTDGPIITVRALSFEKCFIPHKVYMYKIEVLRDNITVPSYIYRSFAEFDELHAKLRKRFPTFPAQLTTGSNMRSNVRAIAQKRIIDVQRFLRFLFSQSPEICHCDLVYTFFHSLLRDNKCDTYIDTSDMHPTNSCQVYLKVQYNSNKELLSVFVGHIKNLAILQTGQAPDAYVKTYVRPDLQNYSKRKTQVVRGTQHPTFNQDLSYEHFPSNFLSTRVLEVSVWNNGGLMDKHKMYMVCIPLLKLNNMPEDRKSNRILEGWFTCDKYI